jgi:diguanylate cyclase (GGDEF)-like protein
MTKRFNATVLVIDGGLEDLPIPTQLQEDFQISVKKIPLSERAISKLNKIDILCILCNVGSSGELISRTVESIAGDEKTKNVPLLFLLPRGTENDVLLKPHSHRFIDYLYKPVPPQLLESRIRFFLEIHKLKRDNDAQAEALIHKEEELRALRTKFEDLSQFNSLSKVPDRRRFDEVIDLEWRRSLRTGRVLSLIMIEIDFFKEYVERHGTQAAEECIVKIAQTLSNTVKRSPDFVAHFGRNKFVAILPETEEEAAVFVAEKMREEVETLHIPHNNSTVSNNITVSLGIASLSPSPDSVLSDFVDTADRLLTRAKRQGGNRVLVMH